MLTAPRGPRPYPVVIRERKENDAMDTNIKKLHPLLTIAAISVTLFSAVGVAAITGVIPHSKGSDEAMPVVASAPAAVMEPAPAAGPQPAPWPAPQPAKNPVAKKQAPAKVAVAQGPAVTPPPAPIAQAPQPVEAPKPVVKPGLL